MWSSSWISVLVAIVATIVTVVSLVVANRSLKVSKQLLIMGAGTEGTSELAGKADELFLSHPALRPYFYDGWPAPDNIFAPPPPAARPQSEADMDRSRLLAAAEYYLDLLEGIWDNVEPLHDDDKASWREWIHDMFETGPILVSYIEHYPTWYPTLTGLLEVEKPGDRCTDPDRHPYAVKRHLQRERQQQQQQQQQAGRADRPRFWRRRSASAGQNGLGCSGERTYGVCPAGRRRSWLGRGIGAAPGRDDPVVGGQRGGAAASGHRGSGGRPGQPR
jgi:hypothetical protein